MSVQVSTLKCPSCTDQLMETVTTALGTLERCPSCLNLWMEQRLIAAYSDDKAACKELLAETQSLLLPVERWCPKCFQKMADGRVRSRGVVLHLCTACEAVWIDWDTLRKFDEFVERAIRSQVEAAGQSPVMPSSGIGAPPLPTPEDNSVSKVFRAAARAFDSIADGVAGTSAYPLPQPKSAKPTPPTKPLVKPGKDKEKPQPTPEKRKILKAEELPPAPQPVPEPTPPPAPEPIPAPLASMPPEQKPSVLTDFAAILDSMATLSDAPVEEEKAAPEPVPEPAPAPQPVPDPSSIKSIADLMGDVPVEPEKKPVSKPAPVAKKPAPPAKAAPVKKEKPKKEGPGLVGRLLASFKRKPKAPVEPKAAPAKPAMPVAKPAEIKKPAPVKPAPVAKPEPVIPPPTVEAPPVPEPLVVAAAAPAPVKPAVPAPVAKPKPVARPKTASVPGGWGLRALPYVLMVIAFGANYARGYDFEFSFAVLWSLMAWAIGMMVRFVWWYPMGDFEQMSLTAMLETPGLSPSKGLPVILDGQLELEDPAKPHGRLVFVQDGKRVALNRFRALDVLSKMFGLKNPSQLFIGPVVLHGWYRKIAEPNVEIAVMLAGKKRRASVARALRWAFAMTVLALSALVLMTAE